MLLTTNLSLRVVYFPRFKVYVLLPPPASLALSDLIFFFVNKIVSYGHDGYVLVQLPQGQNFY